MRGAFFIIMLAAMLIVAYLVVKNLESTPGTTDVETLEVIDKAKDVTREAEKANELYRKRAGEAAP